jgi:acetylornithine deacetylase
MGLTGEERRVCEAIAARRDDLVELAGALIGFDTTARSPGDPPRQEAELQEYLASRLAAVGSKIDLFEPDADALAGKPLVPPGLDFAGRPQLIATQRGAGRRTPGTRRGPPAGLAPGRCGERDREGGGRARGD